MTVAPPEIKRLGLIIEELYIELRTHDANNHPEMKKSIFIELSWEVRLESHFPFLSDK